MEVINKLSIRILMSAGVYILFTLPHITLFMFGVGIKYPNFLLIILLPLFSIILAPIIIDELNKINKNTEL